MIKRPDTRGQRIKRHNRVRGKISGTAERPRLSVFRSENNIYAQIIDDVAGSTLVFRHPFTGKTVRLRSELPEEFGRIC